MSSAAVEEATSAPRRPANTRSRNDARGKSSEFALGLVEQAVSVSRRTAHEAAAIIEAAIEAAENRAAA